MFAAGFFFFMYVQLSLVYAISQKHMSTTLLD
jgi:hypothetical protein